MKKSHSKVEFKKRNQTASVILTDFSLKRSSGGGSKLLSITKGHKKK